MTHSSKEYHAESITNKWSASKLEELRENIEMWGLPENIVVHNKKEVTQSGDYGQFEERRSKFLVFPVFHQCHYEGDI